MISQLKYKMNYFIKIKTIWIVLLILGYIIIENNKSIIMYTLLK